MIVSQDSPIRKLAEKPPTLSVREAAMIRYVLRRFKARLDFFENAALMDFIEEVDEEARQRMVAGTQQRQTTRPIVCELFEAVR